MHILNLNGSNWTVTGWWPNQAIPTLKDPQGNFPLAPVQEIPAEVPGGIQSDLLKAGLIADWNYGLKSQDCEWTEHREWVYRTEFDAIPAKDGEMQVLCFDGLDFSGEIYLNGEKLTDFYGMHIPYEIPVTGLIQPHNILKVYFKLPPEVDGQYGYTSKIREFKCRFNYIWDWCPRIVPVGIWGDVALKTFKRAKFCSVMPQTSISQGDGRIHTTVEVFSSCIGNCTLKETVTFNGKTVAQKETPVTLPEGNSVHTLETEMKNPEIWQAIGYGEHPLYTYQIQLLDNGQLSDESSKTIGFRDITFEKPDQAMPDCLPYKAVINGRAVFLRGINWVPLSPVYGSVREPEYRRQIGILADMGVNLIRVWGGAVLESETFYQVCDELGILVWQEFPQSSSGIDNYPPEDDSYIAELLRIAESFIRRRGHHPSHSIWCAGNELYELESYMAVIPTHPNFTALRRLVNDLDPSKLFLPGSPSGGEHGYGIDTKTGKLRNYDQHGPWDYLGDPDHYIHFNEDDMHLNSEIGAPSAARFSNLLKYSDGYDVWPPVNSNPYWRHRGSWWPRYEAIEKQFGPYPSDGSQLYRYVQYLAFIQGEALRYVGESTRRRFPSAVGYIIWMGNEPFPNASNTSLLEYDGAAKPSYFQVKEAFAPVNISAKYGKVHHTEDETIQTELFVLSDLPAHTEFTASYLDLQGNVLKSASFTADTDNSVISCGEFNLESGKNGAIILRIHTDSMPDKHYYFTRGGETSFGAYASAPETQVKATESGDGWMIENCGDTAALCVYLLQESEKPINLYPNNLTLMPGEKVLVKPFGGGINGPLSIEGMNVGIKYLP